MRVPRVSSSVYAEWHDAGLVLTEGSFINPSLNAITVTPVNEGSQLISVEIGLGLKSNAGLPSW